MGEYSDWPDFVKENVENNCENFRSISNHI